MFEDPACLAAYEAEVDALSRGLLERFGGAGRFAAFRTSNCCGGTSTSAAARRSGSIATAAMNVVAVAALAERGVEQRGNRPPRWDRSSRT